MNLCMISIRKYKTVNYEDKIMILMPDSNEPCTLDKVTLVGAILRSTITGLAIDLVLLIMFRLTIFEDIDSITHDQFNVFLGTFTLSTMAAIIGYEYITCLEILVIFAYLVVSYIMDWNYMDHVYLTLGISGLILPIMVTSWMLYTKKAVTMVLAKVK